MARYIKIEGIIEIRDEHYTPDLIMDNFLNELSDLNASFGGSYSEVDENGETIPKS